MLQEVNESGAEVFTVLLPLGTPLPARRHHILSGEGKQSSLCLEIYQKFVTEQPEKLAKVWELKLLLFFLLFLLLQNLYILMVYFWLVMLNILYEFCTLVFCFVFLLQSFF